MTIAPLPSINRSLLPLNPVSCLHPPYFARTSEAPPGFMSNNPQHRIFRYSPSALIVQLRLDWPKTKYRTGLIVLNDRLDLETDRNFVDRPDDVGEHPGTIREVNVS